MGLIELSESNMVFLCDDERTFLCEKYVNTNSIQHIKSVEFILKDRSRIFLVEAKTSVPNPENSENFKKYIDDISNKAIDSFSLLLSAVMKRRNIDICSEILHADYAKINFHLLLVIKNHKKEWCPPVQSGLEDSLRHFTVAWNWGPQPVIVLTEEMAQQIDSFPLLKRHAF